MTEQERTRLAYIRTGLVMIGFGLVACGTLDGWGGCAIASVAVMLGALLCLHGTLWNFKHG